MQIDTIKMDPDQAKAKLRAYRAQLHRDIDGRYAAAAVAIAIKALAESPANHT